MHVLCKVADLCAMLLRNTNTACMMRFIEVYIQGKHSKRGGTKPPTVFCLDTGCLLRTSMHKHLHHSTILI